MIVVDTSAIMAIALDEPEGERCAIVLRDADGILMSAVTKAELLIVAGRRNRGAAVAAQLQNLDPVVVAVTDQTSEQISAAYEKWGKGIHPASLNICDCFAYALAMERGCPLLFVGNDFSQTDVARIEQ